eukprot:CAMPEP_0198314768 /NCGR_PEP_ID=MMETSP1450-20131203/5284_1 /TAXON_ID=753684 ORGANISM="Madagascaria erythrocladiodes, Strain CCMP3234" /NCGR_SAMPLE_ID=MMETSP1450 /ASSEMBLY_ACC=CAM_ASM_001115 /LENGTH=194 /DNA_ID=CAMNT_0044017843 /DNA_START=160 /DNA_END=744 /DNA_ORIENTATION=-
MALAARAARALGTTNLSVRLLARPVSSQAQSMAADADPSGENQFGVEAVVVADLLAGKHGERYVCRESDLVYDAVKEMVSHNIGSLVVVEGDTQRPSGIVTERDYLEKVIVLGRSSKTTHVKDIMSTKGLVSVPPSANLASCMDLMTEKRIRHLPVVENGVLKGLISIGDVVKSLVESHKKVNDAMRSYIGGTY